MLKEFRCDLHIHTCLSPCGDLDMYPQAIIEKCISERLDVIGICDHNSSENAVYVIKASEGKPVTVLPGMEITTKEEVHVIALFDNIGTLLKLQGIIYESLSGMNREDVFGCQPIVNEKGVVKGFNERLLIGATELSFHESVDLIHRFDGLAIAAHIDRESFGVIGQLGFIPADIKLDALEISPRTGRKKAAELYPELSHYPFVESSDAHFIGDIGKGTTLFCIEKPIISELKKALSSADGRHIVE
jgi:PHP family Zn ribbon phosphoesterase